MKKSISMILACMTVFQVQAGLRAENPVIVKSVKELIENIGSNKTIELAPGTYNITEVAGKIDNPNIQWVNNYDGDEPVIMYINNLIIEGNGQATIVLEPRYAWVMNFYK